MKKPRKRRPITKGEVGEALANGTAEARIWDGFTVTDSSMGHTRGEVTCPFCSEVLTAYIWSLSGGGKRCPCGALLKYSPAKAYKWRT